MERTIMIAIPCMDQVPAPFAQCLAMIRKGENKAAVAFQMGSLIYTSRNNLAVKAVEMESDYTLWLDSDMVFNQNIMLDMIKTLEENDLDILTGLYFRRVPPFSPTLFKKLQMTEKGCEWEDYTDLPEELFEVAGCGFGCVLMKTSILAEVQLEFGNMFAPIANVGEDLSFCWRARELGYKIICDPSIKLGHVGYQVINERFYESYQMMARRKEEAKDV